MSDTKIEWAEKVWNPVTGCTPVSPGCGNCYAKRMAQRLRGRYGYLEDEPFRVTLHPERLEEPLYWKKSKKIFICSMGDLFHPDVPTGFILKIFDMMYTCRHHAFFILTKRPERIKPVLFGEKGYFSRGGDFISNVLLGVSAENQKTTDERLSFLFNSGWHGKKFISLEPLIARSYFTREQLSHLSWVVAGAETGPGKRPAELDWFRAIRDDCQTAKVPFFFKRDSAGGRILDGRMWEEFPN